MKPKSKKSTKLSPAAQKAKKSEKGSADTTKTIASLIARSRVALEDGDLEGAHSLATRACQLLPAESTNVQCIELLGELDIELERFDEARECFLEAVRRRQDLAPESGDEAKFLWLGQLSEGEEAQGWYLKGIEILKRILENTEDENIRYKARTKLCESYCSVVELYLTDLCMLDEAEVNAEKYATLAGEANPDSPVALSLLASVRLSQHRNDEAGQLLDDAHTKLFSKSSVVPSYPERLHLVKLFIESEKYSKALEVLETLQREDEDNVELWYYYTVSYFCDVNDSTREENWKNAGECAEMCLKLYNKMEWDDEPLRAGCLEMLEEIKKAGISIDKEEDDGEDEVDEDEWADSDEDVEMEDA